MSVHTVPMKQFSDEQLVRLYVESQRNFYFEEIYGRYADKVYRRCLSFVKDSARAEDYTHDIFMKLIMRVGSFQESSKFSTWLYSITYNYCMDQIRINKRLAESDLEEDANIADVDDADEFETMEMDAMRLKKVLETVSPDERTILLMKYQDDFSIKEIADTFNLTESAVKMRLMRTKEKVKKKYMDLVIGLLLLISKLLSIK